MIRRSTLMFILALAAIFTLVTFTGPVSADQARPVTGQTIYVPVYTYIHHGDREGKIKLTVTLSIRNICPDTSLTLSTVEYMGQDGKKIRSYQENPITVEPFASVRYAIKESDLEGGLGTGFIVTWQAETPIQAPVIQAVMIGAESTQGISFVTHGHVIKEQYK